MHRVCCVNDAMQHEGIEWIKRRYFYDIVIDLRIAVSHPLLAPRSFALKVMIVSPAPGRIYVKQPEWRRPGTGGLVDINVGLRGAQIRYQPQHGVTIARQAVLIRFGACGQAVKLKLVDTIFLNHLQANTMKEL